MVGDAAVRGYGAAGIHAAGPVAYLPRAARWALWRTVCANPTASGCQWMGSVGIPTTWVTFAEQVVVCTSVRDASSPDSQHPQSPVVSWSGVRVSGMWPSPDGRSIGARALGDFGQGVGGAVTGGAVIIGAGFVRVDVRAAASAAPVAGSRNGQVPPAVQAGRQPGMAFGAGGLSVIVVVVGAVVLDQYVEEPAQVFGAVVAGEGHHGVFAGGQRITDGAVRARIARTWSMVMARRPTRSRSRAAHHAARGRCGPTSRHAPPGVRVDVASQSPWCGARPAARRRGYRRRQGFGLYRGQLLGEVWTSRIVRCSWSRVHSAGSMANNWSTWQRSPSKAVSGSVAVVVMTTSLTSNVSTRGDKLSPASGSVDKQPDPANLGTRTRAVGTSSAARCNWSTSGLQPVQGCVRICDYDRHDRPLNSNAGARV